MLTHRLHQPPSGGLVVHGVDISLDLQGRLLDLVLDEVLYFVLAVSTSVGDLDNILDLLDPIDFTSARDLGDDRFVFLFRVLLKLANVPICTITIPQSTMNRFDKRT